MKLPLVFLLKPVASSYQQLAIVYLTQGINLFSRNIYIYAERNKIKEKTDISVYSIQ